MVSKFNYIKKILLAFLVLIIFSLVLNYFYIAVINNNLFDIFFNNTKLVISGDYFFQHQYFYKEFYNLLQQKELAYSLNHFLGTNFYASKAYYVVGDIYAWLGYFDYQKGYDVLKIMTKLNGLRFLVSGFSMYLFLSSLKHKYLNCLIFSVVYMFSGSISMFIENPMFLSFYSFLPLLYLGLEQLIQKNKILFLSLAITLLAVTNYYLLFSALIFALVYFFVRILVVYGFNFRKIIMCSIYGLLATLIAFLIASIIFYPSVKFMLSSPRINTNLNEYLNFASNHVGRIVASFISPMSFEQNSLYYDYWYYFYQIGIYAGLISLVLLPFVFLKKRNFYYIILIIFCLITLTNPLFGKFFNFTYSFRYTTNISFLLVFLGSCGLENILKVSDIKKCILASITSIILFISIKYFLLNYWFYKVYDSMFEFFEAENIQRATYFVLIYIFIFVGINLFKNKKYLKEVCLVVLLFVASYEVISFNKLSYQKNLMVNKVENIDYDFKKIMEHLKSLDSSYYRVITNKDLVNEHLAYDYPIPVIYDSVYQYSSFEFLKTSRLYPDVSWRFSYQSMDFATGFPMLNIRYLITDDFSQIETYDWYGDLIYKLGKYQVYKFDRPSGMLKSYNNFGIYENQSLELNKDSFIKPTHEVMTFLNKNLLFEKEDFNKLKLENKSNEDKFYQTKTYSNNYLEFDVNIKEDEVLLLSLSYDKGWKAFLNDQETEVYKVNGGLMAVVAKAGTTKISFKFEDKNYIVGKNSTYIGLVVWFSIFMLKLLRSIYVRYYHNNHNK